ncbi:MAG: hypothetical protein VCD00_01490 [Candidatus Hydrogenedentota bacterium]
MASGLASTCTTHPGFEAIGRCKQCGKPYCSGCQVKGPTGMFCCDACKQSHEAFTQRAQQLDGMSKSSTKWASIKIILRKLIIALIVLALAAGGLTYMGIDVPVVGPFFQNLLNR